MSKIFICFHIIDTEMSDEILDKKLVYVSSKNSTFFDNSVNSVFDFYYNMQESIRNVVYIKIMKCEVVLNPHPDFYDYNTGNEKKIQDTDPIFVNVKGYNRLYANIDAGKNIKCFEQITLNMSEKFGKDAHNPPNSDFSFKTEYTSTGCSINDINTIVLDPVEPNLTRFDVQLYDKNYNIIAKDKITVFNMILCIYSKRKKSTMV